MAVYGGPDIVTDGLVLHLDAGNSKSYPGSGNTWYDLSNNNNSSSLSAGVTYSDNSLLFGGTATAPIASSSINTIYTNNKFTYSLWFRYSTYTSYQGIGGMNKNGSVTTMVFSYRIQGAGYTVFFDGSFGNVRRIMTIIPSAALYLNQFINFTTTYNNSTLIGYLNGIEVVRQTYSAQIDDFREKALILGADGGYGLAVNANIAQCLLYNNNLSANEVLQNFNALKGRFGL